MTAYLIKYEEDELRPGISVSKSYNNMVFKSTRNWNRNNPPFSKEIDSIIESLKSHVCLKIEEYQQTIIESGDISSRFLFLKNKIKADAKIPKDYKSKLFYYITNKYKSRVKELVSSKYYIRYYYQIFSRHDLLCSDTLLKDILDSSKESIDLCENNEIVSSSISKRLLDSQERFYSSSLIKE